MRLVLIGPPGAGKGTQAVRLAEALNVPHVSTGDILRRSAASGTPAGVEIAGLIEKGSLVPDELVTAAVAERLAASDASGGCVLDGFPRTVAQAVSLDAMSDDVLAVEFVVDEGALAERIADRARKAVARGEAPRADDNPEVLASRIALFKAETAPVIAHYEADGRLVRVDGMGTEDEVRSRLARVVGERANGVPG